MDGVGRGTREREMDRRWGREGGEKEIERQTVTNPPKPETLTNEATVLGLVYKSIHLLQSKKAPKSRTNKVVRRLTGKKEKENLTLTVLVV